MKLSIEPTAEIFGLEKLTGKPGPVAVRLWLGTADDGTPVHVYVAIVSPQTHDPEVNERFARELSEQLVDVLIDKREPT